MMSGTRGMALVAVGLVVVGAAALLYAPENKTAVKVAILVAGVVVGVVGVVAWLRARQHR